ncbi:cell wall hydrolase [Tepidibacter formicigenes]|jgi:spore germination cell wall hydrolase CwlJ-like protein|uniref:Cell Wall Hydrolase n=1 Tax=Tepidibacter formicigenes DSM 15518 TaxID=1123349 RepID=A0A1M6TQY4_9FIRM|nr:cell wall hydrolase [Tepidibacter formicigenes]SHK59385.1 Cell Wall Hydrolase [Tepidibacter formicigenes DSM 15518]
MGYNYGEPLPDKSGLSEFEGRDSVDLLARMIYSEARGESWKGKQAVAHVAKNRKEKPYKFGDTYEEVLLSPRQFAGMAEKAAREPDTNSQSWNDSLYIAQHIDSQDNPIGGRLYFGRSYPSEATNIIKIGKHYFYNVPAWE